MNGALRQSKSKCSNYSKVGKCRLSAGHLPRSYPGMDSSTGEGFSRVTPWNGSCRVEISLTSHQNWFCKRDCPWMLRDGDGIWSVLFLFDNILLVYIRLWQQSRYFSPHFYSSVLPIHNCYSAKLYLQQHNYHKNSSKNGCTLNFSFCLQVSPTCVVAHANFPIAMGTVETVEGRLPIFSLPPRAIAKLNFVIFWGFQAWHCTALAPSYRAQKRPLTFFLQPCFQKYFISFPS